MTPLCPIGTLKNLKSRVEADNWTDKEAQFYCTSGISMSIDKLKLEGFVEISDEELALIPNTKMELQIDYGTLLS